MKGTMEIVKKEENGGWDRKEFGRGEGEGRMEKGREIMDKK